MNLIFVIPMYSRIDIWDVIFLSFFIDFFSNKNFIGYEIYQSTQTTLLIKI